MRNLEQLLHEELVAAAARFGGGAHAEDVGLHLDGGVAGEEVVAEDVAQVPPPQVVDLRDHCGQARFGFDEATLVTFPD